MSFIKLDSTILIDDKILGLSPDAFTLWVKGLVYSGDQELDGMVPARVVPILGIGIKNPKKAAKELVEVGLWDTVDGGYGLGKDSNGRDKWGKHQATREVREQARETERLRKAAQRAKQPGGQPNLDLSHRDKGWDTTRDTDRTNSGTDGGTPPGVPVGPLGEERRDISNSCSIPRGSNRPSNGSNFHDLRLKNGGKPPASALPIHRIIVDEDDRQAWESNGQRWQRMCGVVDRVAEHIPDGDL